MIEDLLSRSARLMKGSAIRKIGSLQIPDVVSFSAGYPAQEAFPREAFAEIAADVLRSAKCEALQYGPTAGYQPLRELVAELMVARGLTRRADHVVITTGSQQGLDLIGRVLVDPGDVALLELPSYTGAIVAFRNVGADMVGVPQQADGIDVRELDRTVAVLRADGRRVKLLYVIPNFQNPSGLLLGQERRRQLLQWALREKVLIVEDDPYRDLHFSECRSEDVLRPIAAGDRDERAVVYLSSFSKTLAPGFRVGWLSAPQAVAEKIELAKQAVDLCTGGLDQFVVYEACRRGVLAAQAPHLRQLYEERRDAMIAALHRHAAGRLSWATPLGGFFLWARLNGSVTGEELLPHARAHGVTYVPGTAFFVDGRGQEYMRLSFAEPPPERIALGIERLAAALAEAT